MRDELVTALKADGYDVSTATIERKPGRFAEKLDGAGQTDLVVDAVASATCSNVGAESKAGAGERAHFRPVAQLQEVRLMRPGSAAPIMSKTFVYDDTFSDSTAFMIKGDPQYDVADYAALKANIKGCLDGIKGDRRAAGEGRRQRCRCAEERSQREVAVGEMRRRRIAQGSLRLCAAPFSSIPRQCKANRARTRAGPYPTVAIPFAPQSRQDYMGARNQQRDFHGAPEIRDRRARRRMGVPGGRDLFRDLPEP